MTNFDYTRPIEPAAQEPREPVRPSNSPVDLQPPAPPAGDALADQDERPAEVLYVPLAVSVGDGFKLGCGFFMAFVLMMLVGFVLVAALFAVTSLMGLNLPVGR